MKEFTQGAPFDTFGHFVCTCFDVLFCRFGTIYF